jgi:hypothetical protein
MLATQVYRRLDRSLVTSDTLRRQIAKKPEGPEKPGDRRDVNRSRDAFGGDCSDCGCRHGGYAASRAAGVAGSDCIHDAGEPRFWSVGRMYQDHFLQANIPVLIWVSERIGDLSVDLDKLISFPAIPQSREGIQLCPLAHLFANATVCRVANSCLACLRYIASGSACAQSVKKCL